MTLQAHRPDGSISLFATALAALIAYRGPRGGKHSGFWIIVQKLPERTSVQLGRTPQPSEGDGSSR